MKRVFLIVLDSLGIGSMPDSIEYGDLGANTLNSISKSSEFRIKNLKKLGLFNIDGVECGERVSKPKGVIARLSELSKGKDTTTGHWEIAGVISKTPFPTYPDGFPEEIIDEFTKKTGRGVLCNKPYSGTKVIEDFGEEHIKTGKLIVYTSADSVFQIAAHEDYVSLEELYKFCESAREILKGEHAVARVIARPFRGMAPQFYRTPNRHDFSKKPPKSMLDDIIASGKSVIGIGKINDIFSGCGISEYVFTKDNADGIEKTIEYMDKDFSGLCFVNLVDFDMLYGHRNDISGYAKALSYFDEKLGVILEKLRYDDYLIITADHGCDPDFPGTDHTREYVPMIAYNKGITPEDLGTIEGFDYIGKKVLELLDI